MPRENFSQEAHSDWKIVLYYSYINLSAGNKVDNQVEFHRETCTNKDLKGRIRISPEGINGVLSGRFDLLQEYEQMVMQVLEEISEQKVDLNIKYCSLREDLPLEPQLFDSLIVRKTSTVISLFGAEQVGEDRIHGKKLSKKAKAKRKQKKAQIEEALENEESTGGIQWDKAKIQQDMVRLQPSPHLTPDEWNSRLLRAEDNPDTSSALLLDVRNVYESRVGHFSAPNVPTLLTNTRKYSDLPELLANNPHIQEKQEIYMYCTGGVRCERVSVLVQSLYPDKRIYQLGGGIQTYLAAQVLHITDGGIVQPPRSTNLFMGKNFVFDPRRTDPLHGPKAVIGKCLVCSKLHDDYDNGHAPSELKEARCNTCRMLILVCNDCRPRYTCWGESSSSPQRPLLYCGLDQCVHEGAAPVPELVAPPTSLIK